MKQKKYSKSRAARNAALFVAIAFVLQLVFVILLTPQGLSHVYPYLVRFKSEEITHDSSFAEYYDLRSDFSDGELFLLGSDVRVSGSYYVILDYLRFLKKSFDITYVGLPLSNRTVKAVNNYISCEAGTALTEAEEELKKTGVHSEEFYTFVKNLRSFNETLSPSRKLTVKSAESGDVGKDIMEDFSNRIIAALGSANATLSGALSCTNPEEFFDFFDANIELFEDFLGKGEFEKYCEARDLYREGNYEVSKLMQKISYMNDQKAFCVVSNEYVSASSKLYPYLDENGRTYYAVQTKYSDCQVGTYRNITSDFSDMDIPFLSKESVRFVTDRSTASFRDYYRYISNPSSSEDKKEIASYFDDFSTPYYFIVANSPAAVY